MSRKLRPEDLEWLRRKWKEPPVTPDYAYICSPEETLQFRTTERTMRERRSFHIGSKVVPVGLCATDDDTPYPVLFCHEGIVYMADPLNGGIDSEKPHNLVHASDGAPLGDWVPIRPDADLVRFDEYGHKIIPYDTANAIVRMEVEQ